MKPAPNENMPRTRICLTVHIGRHVGHLFCIGSLTGNYNCRQKDLERTFWSVGNMVGPQENGGTQGTLLQKEVTNRDNPNSAWCGQSKTFYVAGCYNQWFMPSPLGISFLGTKGRRPFSQDAVKGNKACRGSICSKNETHPGEQWQSEEATTATSFSKSVKPLYIYIPFFPGKCPLHSSPSYPQNLKV